MTHDNKDERNKNKSTEDTMDNENRDPHDQGSYRDDVIENKPDPEIQTGGSGNRPTEQDRFRNKNQKRPFDK